MKNTRETKSTKKVTLAQNVSTMSSQQSLALLLYLRFGAQQLKYLSQNLHAYTIGIKGIMIGKNKYIITSNQPGITPILQGDKNE